jgi:hypothetical protein
MIMGFSSKRYKVHLERVQGAPVEVLRDNHMTPEPEDKDEHVASWEILPQKGR